MDIEILNDLLNTTISSLFLNKEKHINYFTRDDDNLNYPSDIQINNNKNMNLNNNQNKNYEYKNENFDNQYENIEDNNLCTPELWIKTIGKKKFEDSLKKLNLDEKKINSKYLQTFSLQNLLIEKAKVKNELKKYDNDFKKVFKQMPSRNEKEIMKPLYIYYKTIKNNIEKKKNASVSNTVNPNNNMNKNNNNMNINYNNVRNDKVNVNNNNNNYFANNNLNSNNQKKNTMTNIYKNSNNLINNNNLTNTLIEKKDKKRKLTKEEMNLLENEYYELKKEQNLLKNKLRNYQAEFTKINNRKVKFANDILPVKKEYDKYKANKTRIQEIKDLFSDPENRKDNNK